MAGVNEESQTEHQILEVSEKPISSVFRACERENVAKSLPLSYQAS